MNPSRENLIRASHAPNLRAAGDRFRTVLGLLRILRRHHLEMGPREILCHLEMGPWDACLRHRSDQSRNHHCGNDHSVRRPRPAPPGHCCPLAICAGPGGNEPSSWLLCSAPRLLAPALAVNNLQPSSTPVSFGGPVAETVSTAARYCPPPLPLGDRGQDRLRCCSGADPGAFEPPARALAQATRHAAHRWNVAAFRRSHLVQQR